MACPKAFTEPSHVHYIKSEPSLLATGHLPSVVGLLLRQCSLRRLFGPVLISLPTCPRFPMWSQAATTTASLAPTPVAIAAQWTPAASATVTASIASATTTAIATTIAAELAPAVTTATAATVSAAFATAVARTIATAFTTAATALEATPCSAAIIAMIGASAGIRWVASAALIAPCIAVIIEIPALLCSLLLEAIVSPAVIAVCASMAWKPIAAISPRECAVGATSRGAGNTRSGAFTRR